MAIIQNKKILIVGANSLIASKIVAQLVNCHVVGLINNNDNRVDYNSFEKVHSSLNSLIKENKHFDLIFMIAAYIPYGKMDVPDKKLFISNIDIIAQIVKAYSESRIVFTSSVAVYGNPISRVIRIGSAFNNPNLYGLTKLAGETIIKMHKSYGIIRLSSLYGCGVTSDTFINRLIRQANEDNTIKIFGTGKRLQNYIHIDDAVEIMIKVAVLDENIVMLGVSKESHSNIEIANIVSEKTKANIIYVGIDESCDYLYDAEDCFKKISFYPQKEFKQSVIEMI